MLVKLKALAAAILAFFAAFFAARHYRVKAKRLERQLKKEKHKIHNLEKQTAAIKRKQEKHLKEIKDATKDNSYLDYFDE